MEENFYVIQDFLYHPFASCILELLWRTTQFVVADVPEQPPALPWIPLFLLGRLLISENIGMNMARFHSFSLKLSMVPKY